MPAPTTHQLQLVRTPAGPLDGGTLEVSPLALYIAGLAKSAKQTMLRVLRRAAERMAAPLPLASTDEVRWEALRFGHLELLKDRMHSMSLAPSTINTTLCALRGVAREAWRLGLMPSEEYQRIKDVRGVRGARVRSGRRLSFDELAALITECKRDETPAGARDLCLVALLAGGGLRRAEAVAADLSSWDLAAHELKVSGKGDRERIVFFDDGGARSAVARWIEVRGTSDGPLLCPVDKAGRIHLRRLSPNAVYNALRKRAPRAGLRPFSPHDLRRTFASDLLELSGGDASSVQRLLGHADVRTTMIYDLRGEQAGREVLGLRQLPFRVRHKRSPRKGRRRKRRRV